jgi:hypothetical protein
VHVQQFLLQRLLQPLDLPVVVGDLGLVSRWVMPFSRQIRSNSTSAGRGLPNRPVNCLPLSLSTSPGIPYSRIASTNARHTPRAVARATTAAMTQNREWSSIPVTILHSRPFVRWKLSAECWRLPAAGTQVEPSRGFMTAGPRCQGALTKEDVKVA